MQHNDYYVTSWYAWVSRKSFEFVTSNVSNHLKFFAGNNPKQVVIKLYKRAHLNKLATFKGFLGYSIILGFERQTTDIPSIIKSHKKSYSEKVLGVSLIALGSVLLYPAFLAVSLRSSTFLADLALFDVLKLIHKNYGFFGLYTAFAAWLLKSTVFCFAAHLLDKLINKLDQSVGINDREFFLYEKKPFVENVYFLGTNILRALALSFFISPIRNAALQRQLTLLPKILTFDALVKPGILSYASFVETALKHKWTWLFKGFWFDVGYIFATGKPMF